MAISQSDLRKHAADTSARTTPDVAIANAKRLGKQTAFLSHSHKDAQLAKGVQSFLKSHGWDVYIDWEDSAMPDKPDRKTAERIQQSIVRLDWFLFLATENSMKSRWCPWEIGYADGKKPIDTILVIQTKDIYGNYYGNEYLQLYRYIYATQSGGYAVFRPEASGGIPLNRINYS